MSLIIYTGIPGSGKTYRVVYDLVHGAAERFFVFHNIDGLKMGALESSGEYCRDWREIPNFLSRAVQVELADEVKLKYNRSMLVIVDESQNWFAQRSPDLLAWLSWHRHAGQTIWLIAQNINMLARDYQGLAEYEVRALKGAILNQFVYSYRVNGEKFKIDRLRKDKGIFALYQSFQVGSAPSRRSRIMLWIVVLVILGLGLGTYSFVFGIRKTFARSAPVSDEKKVDSVKIKKAPVKKANVDGVQVATDGLSVAAIRGGSLVLQDASGALVDVRAIYPDWLWVRVSGGVELRSPKGGSRFIPMFTRRLLAVPPAQAAALGYAK